MTEKIDVVKEFIERMKANAKPIYQFIREGKSDEDVVVQLHLILANYANTEHTLNLLKKQRLELKHSVECLRQKLRQIVDNYSIVDDHGVALVSKRKLEELLKEDEKP